MEVENNLFISNQNNPRTQQLQEQDENSNNQEEDQQMAELDGQENHEEEGYTATNPDGFFADTKTAAACSVRVALRVRPLVGRELYESPSICVTCYPETNQLIIGKDRTFAFDKTFDIDTQQEDIFEICVKNLVLGCFQGYNATVLAYGQTGSGKTFTMGSGYTIGLRDEELGIIPRVIKLIFEEVDRRKSKAEFLIKCTFLEIYNEELNDLLDHTSLNQNGGGIDRFMQKKDISIREEKNGSISVYGLREEKVNCYEELASCLDRGSNFRSTASTLMNNCSSRSHAIFTITIEQHIIEDLYKPTNGAAAVQPMQESSEEFMVAKFHFVDLAGSERAKRTGATGATLKEGISINKGLLSLGNVISALTEEGKKNHVPYRDSKLTRILQDSLGGNSRTSMIACISPAEINFEETLNTLKYASRARNIKNKPIVNRDPNSAQIAQLRQQLYDLQRELVGCKKLLISNNIEFESIIGLPQDMTGEMKQSQIGSPDSHQRDYMIGAQEIQKYQQEIKEIKIEKCQKEKKIQQLQIQLEATSEQKSQFEIDYFQVLKEKDLARFQLEQISLILKRKGIYQEIISEINSECANPMEIDEGETKSDLFFSISGPSILEEYQTKVEQQKKELSDKSTSLKTLQNDYENLIQQSQNDLKLLENKEQEIERLKRSVTKLQKENVQIRNEQRKGGRPNIVSTTPQQHYQSVASAVKKNEKKVAEVSPAPVLKKKAQQPLRDASNSQWLSSELDYNIKHFNELFIENLSQSLSTMLITKKVGQPNGEEENKQNIEDIEMKAATSQAEQQQSDDEDSMSNDEEEDEIPHVSEQEKQEIIQSNEEIKKEDENYKEVIQEQETQIVLLDNNLKDKEQLLNAIKESHRLIQNNILEAMKNEYHKKIQSYEAEIKLLEKEKTESIRKADTMQQKNKLEEQYKKKMTDLENKLKDAKQKDREQNGMVKESNKSKLKIKALEGEVDKMRMQKVQMMKKMKEESDKHRKWMQDRVKEIIQVKQQNLKKDREIIQLKRENKRKDLLAKRKQEELSALVKRTKTAKQKQINATNDRNKKKNIDVEKIQSWIVQNTEKMLKNKDLQGQLIQEKSQLAEVEAQINEEQDQIAVFTVKKEKLLLKKANTLLDDEETHYLIGEELQQIDLEIKAIQENVESLEEKFDFLTMKVSTVEQQLFEFSPDDVEQLKFDDIQSIDGAKACLSSFFSILLDVNVYKKQLEQQCFQNDCTIETLRNQFEELAKVQNANEINFQKEIDQMNFEFKEKEKILMSIIMENAGPEVEQLLSNIDRQFSGKGMNVMKNKENELGEGISATIISPSTIQSTIKKQSSTGVVNSKMEVKKQKEIVVQQSKTQMSKRIAELDRKTREDEKRMESLKHKLEQTQQEKDLYRRQLDTAKQKIKTQEIQDVKLSKINSSEEAVMQQQQQMQSNKEKLVTLQEVRKDRKLKKLGSQQIPGLTGKQQSTNAAMNEPRVIADEPMEDDNEEEEIAQRDERAVKRMNTMEQQAAVAQLGKQISDIKLQNEQEQQTNVFSRLSQPNKPPKVTQPPMQQQQQQQQPTQQQQQPPTQPETVQNGYSDDHKWKCIISKEQAHTGQICALASVGNQLYSTSNKSLKIWDLDTMTCVSDIQAHSSFIKCMTIWEDKKLLLTASDKMIMLWDMISLTNVGQLKGHKEEIKTMTVTKDGNMLFSAGKGSQQGGALLIWDLRKGASHIEEKEKNQDIFSVITTPDYLFYGCRNHYVYPMNIKTFDILTPFEPPHFDAVTSLAILDDVLISGSRDKNLRCWNYSNLNNSTYDVMQAHNDWINSLETDAEGKEMYSGGKDGVVKVWKMKRNKLHCAAALSSSSGGINSLCKIDRQFGKMFAQGSADRSIRMWKFKDKYLADQLSSPEFDEDEVFNQAEMNQDFFEGDEIEQQLLGMRNPKEEMKEQYEDMSSQQLQFYPHLSSAGVKQQMLKATQYQPVIQSNKLQQMRRQKRLQDNQKKQQQYKENDIV